MPIHEQGAQGSAQSQDAAFFLSNYRLGKTLGVGSFGKVLPLPTNSLAHQPAPPLPPVVSSTPIGTCPDQSWRSRGAALRWRGSANDAPRCLQVKVAEHVLTGHKVAIKILNRRKIKQMDMDEKGAPGA